MNQPTNLRQIRWTPPIFRSLSRAKNLIDGSQSTRCDLTAKGKKIIPTQALVSTMMQSPLNCTIRGISLIIQQLIRLNSLL